MLIEAYPAQNISSQFLLELLNMSLSRLHPKPDGNASYMHSMWSRLGPLCEPRSMLCMYLLFCPNYGLLHQCPSCYCCYDDIHIYGPFVFFFLH